MCCCALRSSHGCLFGLRVGGSRGELYSGMGYRGGGEGGGGARALDWWLNRDFILPCIRPTTVHPEGRGGELFYILISPSGRRPHLPCTFSGRALGSPGGGHPAAHRRPRGGALRRSAPDRPPPWVGRTLGAEIPRSALELVSNSVGSVVNRSADKK